MAPEKIKTIAKHWTRYDVDNCNFSKTSISAPYVEKYTADTVVHLKMTQYRSIRNSGDSEGRKKETPQCLQHAPISANIENSIAMRNCGEIHLRISKPWRRKKTTNLLFLQDTRCTQRPGFTTSGYGLNDIGTVDTLAKHFLKLYSHHTRNSQ